MKNKDEILDIYKKNPEELYGDWFFKNYHKSRSFQNEFSKKYFECYHPKSVLDMGCACGWYLEGFAGKISSNELQGVEYVYDTAKKYFPKEIESNIIYGDLTKHLNFQKKYDLVISLEVAEHLPEGSEEIYIDNIVQHASEFILFSAAETEDGNYHINVKPMSFWINMFKKRGFELSEKDTEKIRKIYRDIDVRNPYKRYMSKTALMLKRKTKIGFIRGLWGVFDESNRIKKRRFRIENDIQATVSNKFCPVSEVYVFGEENAKTLESKGVKNIHLINPNPFIFDIVKYQYRHKMEILRYAMEEDGYDEIIYLDWDCIPQREITFSIWEKIREKDSFQANLMLYHRKKCFWREEDQRKVPNGGFLYIADKNVPSKGIWYWDRNRQDNDEPAWAKVVEDMMGGKWKGVDEYWKRFETTCCNLRAASPYEKSMLKSKNAEFIHYQGGR